jgi:ring-1,2-phenylacetyl-CoA epoxidase subunit PaaC
MVRLGDGTEEAHLKTQNALNTLWKYTHEFFSENEDDKKGLSMGIGVDLTSVKNSWLQKVREIMYMATLKIPENDYQLTGGKEGKHTEHMGYILAEMQFLPATYPDARW